MVLSRICWQKYEKMSEMQNKIITFAREKWCKQYETTILCTLLSDLKHRKKTKNVNIYVHIIVPTISRSHHLGL